MSEYRSAFYPDHVLRGFDVLRVSAAAGQVGGYYGRATWCGPQDATAYTYCGGDTHFSPDGALACIKRWHEVRTI